MTAGIWLVGGPTDDDRDDLRHSLRSVAANAPDIDEAWIVGDVPTWVHGARAIALAPQPEKFANMRASWSAFVNHPDAPATHYVFNDDHFVTEAVTGPLPVCHLGKASDYLDHILGTGVRRTGNTATKALIETAAWVAQRTGSDPLAYYAHTPLAFDTAKVRDLLDAYPTTQRLEPMMLYPLAGIGDEGRDVGNAKAKDDAELARVLDQAMPYLSTNPVSWPGAAGEYVRGMFGRPCRWEA